MKRTRGRYNHKYNGGSNSRGKRKLSKIHKGIKYSETIEKSFKELEKLYVREDPFNGVTNGPYALY